MQWRVTERRNENISFFEERGYDRIWNNLEYVPIGAGEGHTWRFDGKSAIGKAEIHSSAGTILFCYGPIGVALFIGFLLALMRGAGTRWAVMLLPALFYSVAHQGLRFTMLWILFALFVALKEGMARVAKPTAPSATIATPAMAAT